MDHTAKHMITFKSKVKLCASSDLNLLYDMINGFASEKGFR